MSKYKTRQQLFNSAYTGLASQGFEKALLHPGGEVGCAYRSPDGKKCAIGWNIADDDYSIGFEGHTTEVIDVRRAAGVRADDIEFAEALQEVHDEAASPDDMHKQMKSFATQYGLTVPALPESASE